MTDTRADYPWGHLFDTVLCPLCLARVERALYVTHRVFSYWEARCQEDNDAISER